jgi:hypothetical protein
MCPAPEARSVPADHRSRVPAVSARKILVNSALAELNYREGGAFDAQDVVIRQHEFSRVLQALEASPAGFYLTNSRR